MHVPHPRRHRHRVPRRRDQLRAAPTTCSSGSTCSPTPTPPTLVSEDFQRHRGPRRPVLRLRPGHAAPTTRRSWAYEERRPRSASGRPAHRSSPTPDARHGDRGGPVADGQRAGELARDETLQHPRCVFQILKRHYARYTPEMVERGLRHPAGAVRRGLPRPVTENSGPRAHRPACLLRSAGPSTPWARSSSAAGAILQLLLGNIGRPGGGIMALRGHASIQGSTDIPTLFNLLPGYLPMPDAGSTTPRTTTSSAGRGEDQKGFWANARRLHRQPAQGVVGRRRDRRQRLRLRLPAADERRPRHLPHRADMLDGKVPGYFLLGREPGRRLGQRPAAAAGHGQPGLAGRARPPHDRVGHLLEGRPGDRDRGAADRGHRHRGVLPARRPPTWRRRARSPRPSGCCSGGTRRSSRPGDCRSDL